MKILLIDVNCKSGSTGKLVYDLYSEINKNGDEAAIAYGRGKIIKEKNIFKFGIRLETNFHVLMNRLTGIHGSFSLFSTLRLINFIKRFKPEIIHLHELHGYFLNIVTLLKFLKKTRIKIIWTFHCEYMYEGKGFNSHYNSSLNRKNEYPKSLFFDLSRWTVKRYQKTLENFPDLRIVTPSNWLLNNVKQSYLSKYSYKVIKNGVNQDIFKPYKYHGLLLKDKIPINKKIVLTVAPDFTDPRKGGKIFLEVANKILKLDPNFAFIMVGNHNYLNLPNNVISIPRTSNQVELAKLYSLADVFLITSLIENFPTTCIEALSCGTPIIGFKGGGTEETAPSTFGYFFEKNEINELIDLILNSFQLFNNKKMLNSLLKYAQGTLSKNKMMNNYYNLYKELL
jgi:glycosyltransferase involved in cell wall biosynthesis